MISKKIAVFVVLSSLIFYEFNELKVPETIEEPFNYRINKGILKAVFYMVSNIRGIIFNSGIILKVFFQPRVMWQPVSVMEQNQQI